MTEDREDDQHKGFKVHDRRRFSESGAPREPDAETRDAAEQRAATQRPEPQPTATDPFAHGTTSEGPHGYSEQMLNEINFPTFVISLCTQALAHLGEIPDPATGTISADLTGARQLIDILAMLQEKTRGNLDADESTLLEQALYDLRIKYVEHAQRR